MKPALQIVRYKANGWIYPVYWRAEAVLNQAVIGHGYGKTKADATRAARLNAERQPERRRS